MTLVNQRGESVFEDFLHEGSDVSHEELKSIVFQILERLSLQVMRTNATKHGHTEIVITPS